MIIDAKTDIITDDTPWAIGKKIKIIPALLDRRSAGGAVLIDVDCWAFKLDYGTNMRFYISAKCADYGIRLTAINGEFLLEVPAFLVIGKKGISKSITEDLFAELSFDGRLIHFVEFAA